MAKPPLKGPQEKERSEHEKRAQRILDDLHAQLPYHPGVNDGAEFLRGRISQAIEDAEARAQEELRTWAAMEIEKAEAACAAEVAKSRKELKDQIVAAAEAAAAPHFEKAPISVYVKDLLKAIKDLQ